MKWFRGVIREAKDTAKGLQIVRGIGRGVRELQNLPAMQQRGFISVPVDGDTFLVLQSGDLEVVVATESTDRPAAEPGETILYSAKDCFMRLMPDGTVRIKAKKVILGSDDAVANPMDGVVNRSCLCAFTGGPHPDGSSVVFARKFP